MGALVEIMTPIQWMHRFQQAPRGRNETLQKPRAGGTPGESGGPASCCRLKGERVEGGPPSLQRSSAHQLTCAAKESYGRHQQRTQLLPPGRTAQGSGSCSPTLPLGPSIWGL